MKTPFYLLLRKKKDNFSPEYWRELNLQPTCKSEDHAEYQFPIFHAEYHFPILFPESKRSFAILKL